MKSILFSVLALGGLALLPGCTVDDDEVVRTTTVTEQTTVQPTTVVPATQTVITR